MDNTAALSDPKLLRRTLGTFVTGVTVVTTIDADGRPRGMTANSFTSVSLDPPLVLICIGNHAASFEAFGAADRFAISILAEEQQEVSALFASKTPDKFDQVSWRVENTGAPVIDGAVGWLDCSLHERVLAGDHLILIGRVMAFASNGGRPLGFFAGQYVNFSHEQDLLDRTAAQTAFGCLLELSDRLLLCRDPEDQGWTLPTVQQAESPRAGRDALRALCRSLGVEVSLSFIYSVFTAESGALSIVYLANPATGALAQVEPDSSAALFEVDDIPWESISSPPVRAMLQRYLEERSAGRFGIYVESDAGGQVALLDGSPQPFELYATKAQR